MKYLVTEVDVNGSETHIVYYSKSQLFVYLNICFKMGREKRTAFYVEKVKGIVIDTTKDVE